MLFKKKSCEIILYEWLNAKKSLKESSYNKYLYSIENYIIPCIGKINLKKLKYSDIIAIFKTEKVSVLENSSKNVILAVIKSFIKYCIEKKYIKSFKQIDLKFN